MCVPCRLLPCTENEDLRPNSSAFEALFEKHKAGLEELEQAIIDSESMSEGESDDEAEENVQLAGSKRVVIKSQVVRANEEQAEERLMKKDIETGAYIRLMQRVVYSLLWVRLSGSDASYNKTST